MRGMRLVAGGENYTSVPFIYTFKAFAMNMFLEVEYSIGKSRELWRGSMV
jgi:hypothetical protein